MVTSLCITLEVMSWYTESKLLSVFSLLCFPNSLVPRAGCKRGGECVSHGLCKTSGQPFLILLLIPLLIFCSVSLLQQAKMKSHSLEHRSQEQPLLQPKQVQYC